MGVAGSVRCNVTPIYKTPASLLNVLTLRLLPLTGPVSHCCYTQAPPPADLPEGGAPNETRSHCACFHWIGSLITEKRPFCSPVSLCMYVERLYWVGAWSVWRGTRRVGGSRPDNVLTAVGLWALDQGLLCFRGNCWLLSLINCKSVGVNAWA